MSLGSLTAGRHAADRQGRLGDATTDFSRYFVTLAGAVAVSGLAELLLQRVIYRVGVHIPRSGVVLDAYTFLTRAGDFAFRTTAVLLALVAVLALAWLLQRRERVVAVLFAALLAANILAWPLGITQGALLAPILLALATAWLAGRRLARRGLLLSLAVLSAAAALVASQYLAGMSALGDAPGQVSNIQLFSEVCLLGAAGLAGLAAARSFPSRLSIAMAAALALTLGAAYAREPSTVAIVSLWATGVTMSLPGALYVAGFGAVAFAVMAWIARPDTRHLAIGLALLLVAGLQPQALHHGITAFLGLALLSIGGPGASAEPRMEVSNNAA